MSSTRWSTALVGLGPLEPPLRDPGVSDVLVNGSREVWVERRGVLERTDVVFIDDSAVISAVERTRGVLNTLCEVSER